jgi:hypothetical protein
VLLAVSRRRLARARRDYRPDEVAAWARVQVMTKLGLLVAVTGAPPAWLMIM